MLKNFVGVIKCEVCGGDLFLDFSSTMDDYSVTILPEVINMSDEIDEYIGKYLVYTCVSCNAFYKYTYKEIEYYLRKHLTERLLKLVIHGQILDTPSVLDKFFMYCGKCNGFDGKGNCPKTLFNKCKIKRFPCNEL